MCADTTMYSLRNIGSDPGRIPTALGAEDGSNPSVATAGPLLADAALAIGYRWMYVPESPPGLRPSRLHCAAMYEAVMSSPRLGVLRPSMESAAITST